MFALFSRGRDNVSAAANLAYRFRQEIDLPQRSKND
jgi:hypothetical protein